MVRNTPNQTKKKTPFGVFKWWAGVDCLARSRLTSLRVLQQSFQLFAKTLRSQLTRARTTDKAPPCGGSHQLTHIKKEVRTKVQPLF